MERFVPRAACEWDLEEGGPWREVEGTLCFIDISGFTNLSERLALRGRIGVEELTEVLNRVFGTMLEIAFARGGRICRMRVSIVTKPTASSCCSIRYARQAATCWAYSNLLRCLPR